ncbi:hypothetical protein CVT24_009850 [Panaeolus cyanescens]|uniref:RING-type domain-containing protein n=1 Tax=Panaeolus cyanescens TaxID=181874 RepID=A0A409VXX2_9AGAR|nr:hypothetical protein CVT24_009850 [Panaeolus cyanescens]
MALTIKINKGKKRVIDEPAQNILSATETEPPHPTKRGRNTKISSTPSANPEPIKKARRAETRQCPICSEHIPLRLLPVHRDLEDERLATIIGKVGSLEPIYDEDADNEPGPSSRARRSAIKARKSMTTQTPADIIEQSTKTIQAVRRRRKQRYGKLKDMAREEEESARDPWLRRFTGEEVLCPVCSTTVRGDQDVIDAHVDACLAYENRRAEEARERELEHRRAIDEGIWEGEEDATFAGDIRGAGFQRRLDVEDSDIEVDIEGDDNEVFGEVQFTEGDIVPVVVSRPEIDEDGEVEIEDDGSDDGQKTLQELVAASAHIHQEKASLRRDVSAAEGEADQAILNARQRKDKASLVTALENKIKLLESMPSVVPSAPLVCRICLDPYNEPTVSTGCWHTCCKECWLRCLGSTKLCPICKRITGATDLRRVYL